MHRELVDRAKLGDEEAFDALARLVGDKCMAIAFRILRDADLAEDAAQAALIKAWRELRSLRDPDRFEPWLHRILTHECYAEARRRGRWSTDIRILPSSGAYDPGAGYPHGRRPRPARASAPAPDPRTTRRPRLPSLPRPVLARGRGPTRHPARDREVPTPLRHDGASSEPRGRRSNADGDAGATRMTTPRDPDRLIAPSSPKGPERLPDRSYDTVRGDIDRTRQRVVIGPWREVVT